MREKRDMGWLFLLLMVLGGLFGATRGCIATPANLPARDPLDVLNEAFFGHAICWGPCAILLFGGVCLGGIWLFLALQRHKMDREIHEVEIAQRKAAVMGPQVVADGHGQMVLVTPRLATRAITPVAADAPADSEQLRAATVIANALKRGAVIPPAVGSLAAATEPPAGDSAPIQVQVMRPDELGHVLREVRPKLAALAVQEEGTDEYGYGA